MKEAQASASEKLPPIHPGEILNEEFLRPMNITRSRLAEAIGVDPRCIHAIVRGQRSITAETALLLSRFFGTPPSFGWVCKANMNSRPQGGRVSCNAACRLTFP